MRTPILSIITPTLNRRDMIAEAIESLRSIRDVVPTEHIIVDGGSTDGTIDMLARHDGLRLIADPGSGVYEALNRGIAAAKGRFVGFLNSDDVYDATGLAAALAAVEADDNAEFAVGDAILFHRSEDATDRTLVRMSPIGRTGRQVRYEPGLLATALTAPPLLNAHLFRRELLRRVGPFDPRYRISADREFMLRLVLAGAGGIRIDRTVYRYRQHGGSLTLDGSGGRRRQTAAEHVLMAKTYVHHPAAAHARAPLRRWRAREAAVRLWRDFRRAEFGAAWRDGHALWRDDALWPLRALAMAPLELPRILIRRRRLRALQG